ncbi:preprotein translocase subunit SecY [Candidatus Micrarchaeota archaeon]|nr:preprotein translocase subunit SecY [Candidatus Micrarchaeota archaeon]
MDIFGLVHSIASHLPEIKAPVAPPSAKERLIWTGVALVLFFMMYNTTCFGVVHSQGTFDFLQTITASKIGSLLTAGIGPIVFASIFLQLFNGAGLLSLNMKDKEDKKKFLETQKVLAIVLALVEGIIFVVTLKVGITPIFTNLGEGMVATVAGGQAVNAPYTMVLVILQIAFGSIIILYLDEIVTKYGIGSGISLFIAAGVSFSIVTGVTALIFGSGGIVSVMSEGGAEALPNALLAIAPFIFTIIVFFVVVYAEGIKVEIPIAFERVRGLVPKLPLKYFYVSNIPVIFASALILNIQLFGTALQGNYFTIPLTDIDITGIVHAIGYVDSQGQLRDGLLYLMTPIYAGSGTLAHWEFLINAQTPIYHIPEWVHAIMYVLTLSVLSLLFGLFWVETANMDAKSVANQLMGSGLQIPGFRRDPRMLETILNKHILPLTVLGSISVGLLAGIADLTGALGTGTGILLSVGILYKMYEQMEQQQMFELYPALKGLTGG